MHLSLRRTLAAVAAAALAGVLGVTAAATSAVVGAPPAAAAPGDGDAYFFPYFTGESTADGETISFAVSTADDPTSWQTLNGGEPVLTSTLGTQGLRDPFVIRSGDGSTFYLLATDLQIHGGGNFGDAQETGSRSMMVWESDDLVDWSAQREIDLAPENAGNLWAPEAFWDAANQEYVVYWASALYPESLPPAQRNINDSYQRMMYATTTDFRTFSEPRVWIDERQGAGLGMIDSTVVQLDGVYHRFTKDESDMTVRQETSTDLHRTQGVTFGDGWSMVAERVGVGQPNPWGGTFTAGEGPSVFPSLTDDRWYMIQDQPSYHGGQGYMLFETADLASGQWTSVPGAALPPSPRHGTVLPITAAEHAALLGAYGGGTVPGDGWYAIESAHSGLVLDIAGQSTAPGALLTQYTRWDGTNQQFRFLDSGNGYHRIQARHSGLVLDVYDWNADDGADIAQWDDLNATNQQWRVRQNGDGTVTFVNRHSGKALDVWEWSTEPGSRISQYTDSGAATQRWNLHPVG
ncbi:hypothetical protein GCM10028784_11590 [Myceligenerans cantabricum]